MWSLEWLKCAVLEHPRSVKENVIKPQKCLGSVGSRRPNDFDTVPMCCTQRLVCPNSSLSLLLLAVRKRSSSPISLPFCSQGSVASPEMKPFRTVYKQAPHIAVPAPQNCHSGCSFFLSIPIYLCCCSFPSSTLVVAGAATGPPAPLSALLAQESKWDVLVGSEIDWRRLMWL